MPYQSIKHYGHEAGLSCVFRQWRAESHCSKLHGYALAFTFTFEADVRDECDWVVDFGALKPLKEALATMFDHTLIVAKDDPKAAELVALHGAGLADVRTVNKVGCESFAELAHGLASAHLQVLGVAGRVWVKSVRCAEHGGNAGVYEP